MIRLRLQLLTTLRIPVVSRLLLALLSLLPVPFGFHSCPLPKILPYGIAGNITVVVSATVIAAYTVRISQRPLPKILPFGITVPATVDETVYGIIDAIVPVTASATAYATVNITEGFPLDLRFPPTTHRYHFCRR